MSQGPFQDVTIVIFNVDTTDLTRSKEICQISAKCNNNRFQQYILPNKNVSTTRVNGLQIRNRFGNVRKLFHNGIEVNAVSPSAGLINFMDFLRNQTDSQVLLTAHNCFTFHGTTIVREIIRYNLLETFRSRVLGFADTLPIFKQILPNRIQGGYNLEALAADYLEDNIPEVRHAAVNVEILVSLITEVRCTNEIIQQHLRKLDHFIQSMPENVEDRINGLAVLNQQNQLPPETRVITQSMLKKMAKAGISIDVLTDVFANTGSNGITELLQGIREGIPAVTNTQSIIQTIINRLISFINQENGEAN